MKEKYPYKLQPLPYEYNALEPYIDTQTMRLHHNKHYKSYVDNLNDALKDYPKLQEKNLTKILSNPELIPIRIRKKVIDNGGGVYNHKLYFNIMGKANNINPFIELERYYGSFDNFKNIFKNVAMKLFGSGWVWLVQDRNNKMTIVGTPNQNTPLPFDMYPILGIDLWEHAYYKKYDNRKSDYIDNWFNVINWDEVSKRYKKTSN